MFQAKSTKLTNAEKQRRYREKRKLDAARDKAYKEKEKIRNKKQKKIAEMSDREKRKERKSWKARQAKCRRKKKEQMIDVPENSCLPSTSSTPATRTLKYRLCAQKKYNKELIQEIENLKRKNQAYKKSRDMYKKRSERSKQSAINKLLSTPEDLLSPKSNVNKTLEQLRRKKNEKIIAKKLVFQETVVQTLKTKYQNSDKRKTKRGLGFLCLSQLVQRYRLKSVASKTIGLQKSKRMVIEELKKRSKVKSQIEAFFLRSDVSRHSAGIKETITRKKVKMQKRYLLASMKDSFKKFQQHHGGSKLSFTTFTRHRPFYVCKPMCDTRDTCLCKQHVNIELKAKKLKQLGLVQTSDPHVLCEEISCDKGELKCMYGMCNVCKDLSVHISPNIDSRELEIQTQWKKWDIITEQREKIEKNEKKLFSVKVTAKVQVVGTKQQLITEFNEDLKKFKIHIFNIKKQNEAYKTAKEKLKDNEAILHVDFSENYQCKLAEEIQGFHFGASRKQCSIHTGILYVKRETPLPFGTLSENLDHGPEAIWTHLNPILEQIMIKHPAVEVIHFFSDGPSSQYKQKKNFYLFNNKLYEYGFKAGTWNFFESSHGKGAPDGVGGALKRAANMYVANGHDIADPTSLYNVLKKQSKVQLYYIEPKEFDKIVTPRDLKAIPGTHQIHQVTTTKIDMMSTIAFRKLSCFCGINCWLEGTYCECMFKADTLQKLPPIVTKSGVNYKAIYNSDSSEEENDSSGSVSKSSNASDEEIDSSEGLSKPERLEDPSPQKIKQGVYILVQYLGSAKTKTKYRYAGICQNDIDEEDGDVKVLFLNVVGEEGSLFKVNETDLSYVNFDQILKILPTPKLVRKGHRVFYKFPLSLDVYEQK